MNFPRLILSFFLVITLLQSHFCYDPIGESGYVYDARQAAKALQEALQKALISAMQTKGISGAVEICNERALPLTAEVSRDHGLSVRRTALRVRNPVNLPSSWEMEQLLAFEKRVSLGESLQSMEASTEEAGHLHYMKAIPVGNACLLCHGSQIDTGLYATIRKLYPEDQATGFNEGQLRGAFSLKVPLRAHQVETEP